MFDFKKLIQDIEDLNSKSKFELKFDGTGGFIEFFNTSDKCFVLGLKSVLKIFEDIKNNISDFKAIQTYTEKPWRDAASKYYSDDAANALATVQTKPLFATLSKFISIANGETAKYDDNVIDLDLSKIHNTISYLNDLIAQFKLSSTDEVDIESRKDIMSEFANWLIIQNTKNYFENDLDKTLKGLTSYQEKYKEIFGKDIFEVDFSKLDAYVQDIKDNIYDKSNDFWKYSDKISSHQPRAILGEKNYLKFLEEYDFGAQISVSNGYNKIYFGAPGTGKSYAVSQELKKVDESQIERIIFHPDYDYSSFIGGYKPITEKDHEGKDVVKYRFVPQIFISIFEKAHRNPNKYFYLVIEEINRGNCAEIFGDIFQLLDRNPDYAVTPSEDLYKYLLERDQLSKIKVLKKGKLIMPTNLVLLATMNTSDQSLYPMDSAFKRRWDWEYVPIKQPLDKDDKSCPSFEYRFKLDDNVSIRWVDFIKAVNWHILQNPSLGLDKCIGNFFVKPEADQYISLSTLVNKVIFYLWNDVFKDEENDIFTEHTYSDYFPIESSGLARIKGLIAMFEKQEIFHFEKVLSAEEGSTPSGEAVQ
ncbi:AAA family ATPase [Sphingobacterium faecium]|uniref:McrB family protein n=1 Tax=Sphingobacterium faecium TaxID=34087 RepID=UPI0021B54815|nr:AAA family ATPase [Sphingobacterium faecium]UXD71386.1 AAA family ATPase [Sphingobacterium faecium]